MLWQKEITLLFRFWFEDMFSRRGFNSWSHSTDFSQNYIHSQKILVNFFMFELRRNRFNLFYDTWEGRIWKVQYFSRFHEIQITCIIIQTNYIGQNWKTLMGRGGSKVAFTNYCEEIQVRNLYLQFNNGIKSNETIKKRWGRCGKMLVCSEVSKIFLSVRFFFLLVLMFAHDWYYENQAESMQCIAEMTHFKQCQAMDDPVESLSNKSLLFSWLPSVDCSNMSASDQMSVSREKP